jgi:hypothetical protein
MGNTFTLPTASKIKLTLILLVAVSVVRLLRQHHNMFSTSKVIGITDYCLQHRGSNGNWYRNEIFGRETFYLEGFRATNWWRREGNHNSTAVFDGNKYAWNDSTSTIRNRNDDPPFLNYQCAPIQALKLDNFCDTMRSLGIQRILFVGDSLTLAHYKSLYGLLNVVKGKANGVNSEGKIDCSSASYNSSFFIQVILRQESLGPNLIPSNMTVTKSPTTNSESIV